jgi:hypothetical protein
MCSRDLCAVAISVRSLSLCGRYLCAVAISVRSLSLCSRYLCAVAISVQSIYGKVRGPAGTGGPHLFIFLEVLRYYFKPKHRMHRTLGQVGTRGGTFLERGVKDGACPGSRPARSITFQGSLYWVATYSVQNRAFRHKAQGISSAGRLAVRNEGNLVGRQPDHLPNVS